MKLVLITQDTGAIPWSLVRAPSINVTSLVNLPKDSVLLVTPIKAGLHHGYSLALFGVQVLAVSPYVLENYTRELHG